MVVAIAETLHSLHRGPPGRKTGLHLYADMQTVGNHRHIVVYFTPPARDMSIQETPGNLAAEKLSCSERQVW